MDAIKILKQLKTDSLANKYPTVSTHYLPPPKYTDKTSNGLTKCIIDFVRLNGYQAERINSTGRQLDQRKTVTDVLGRKRTIGSIKWIKGPGQVGTADISATIKGRSVKIEVKCKATGDRYQSQRQKDYQKEIERAGGIYIIARTFEDFYNWYVNFLKDE